MGELTGSLAIGAEAASGGHSTSELSNLPRAARECRDLSALCSIRRCRFQWFTGSITGAVDGDRDSFRKLSSL